jgi:hypothetical protein
MTLADERGSASALPLRTCKEPDCKRQQWVSERRGRLFVHSDFCEQHSHLPMFEVPWRPELKPKRNNPAAVFRKEVERQRLARERQPRDAA